MEHVRSMSLTLLRCTPNSRENLWSAVLLIIGPQERSDSHNPASSGAGFVATQKRTADDRATLCPSWRSRIAHGDRER
jgi:hypothetical protein